MDCSCICACPKCNSEDIEMAVIDQDYIADEFYSKWHVHCLSCGYEWNRIEHYQMTSVENEEL